MGSYIFVSSQSGEGAQAYLNNRFDGAYVASGVVIGSSTATAIIGLDSYHVVTVHGAAIGAIGGVDLGAVGFDKHDQRLIVTEGAEVEGFFYDGAAILGYRSFVDNAGFLYGARNGLLLQGQNSRTTSIVNNSGTIEGRVDGISHSGGEAFTLNNFGSIIGQRGYSYFDNDGSADKIINKGEMIGRVSLGAGDDVYDGRKGHLHGAIGGGGGDDRIYGGNESDTLGGGAGNDRLIGGKGNDTFVFSEVLSASNNIDRIKDFSPGEDEFQLYSSHFDGLLRDRKLSGSSFQDISNHKEQSDDRILYKSRTGDLYFDHDGKGGDAAIKFAHLDNHAALTAADFVVV